MQRQNKSLRKMQTIDFNFGVNLQASSDLHCLINEVYLQPRIGWDFGDFVLGDFGDFSVFQRKESDDGMIKINYFDERELLVRREIKTKAPKGTEAKGTQVLPPRIIDKSFISSYKP